MVGNTTHLDDGKCAKMRSAGPALLACRLTGSKWLHCSELVCAPGQGHQLPVRWSQARSLCHLRLCWDGQAALHRIRASLCCMHQFVDPAQRHPAEYGGLGRHLPTTNSNDGELATVYPESPLAALPACTTNAYRPAILGGDCNREACRFQPTGEDDRPQGVRSRQGLVLHMPSGAELWLTGSRPLWFGARCSADGDLLAESRRGGTHGRLTPVGQGDILTTC